MAVDTLTDFSVSLYYVAVEVAEREIGVFQYFLRVFFFFLAAIIGPGELLKASSIELNKAPLSRSLAGHRQRASNAGYYCFILFIYSFIFIFLLLLGDITG